MPREAWLDMWNVKLEEVIDQYQPDLIWFDSWLDRIPEKNRQEFAAYYLNAADKWGKTLLLRINKKICHTQLVLRILKKAAWTV